jgi:hypothetical protein
MNNIDCDICDTETKQMEFHAEEVLRNKFQEVKDTVLDFSLERTERLANIQQIAESVPD